METLSRITGMPTAIPNGATRDIRFLLTVENGDALPCVANYGVAAQVASGLGAALDMLRMALAAQGAVEPVAPDRDSGDSHSESDDGRDDGNGTDNDAGDSILISVPGRSFRSNR